MAATSCYPDLRYLEADCIQQQSEVLRSLANDIHYAASIFNYTAYDIDNRSLATRRAGWVDTPAKPGSRSVSATLQSMEQEVRAKMLLEDNAMMLDIADQVKSGLKTLIKIVCKTPVGADDSEGSNGLSKENTGIDPETTSTMEVNLSLPLGDQLAKGLTQAKRVHVDSYQFIPHAFHAVSTPIYERSEIDNFKQNKSERTRKARVIDETAMSKCQAATMALQDIIQPQSRRARGRPPGSKNKPRLPYIGVPARSALRVNEKDVERSQSPTELSRMEKLDKQLLAWIPPKIGFSPLPVDEKMKALMMHDVEMTPEELVC